MYQIPKDASNYRLRGIESYGYERVSKKGLDFIPAAAVVHLTSQGVKEIKHSYILELMILLNVGYLVL